MSGPAQPVVSLDVVLVCIPSTQRSEAEFCVSACAQTTATAAPDYNTAAAAV